MNKYDSMLEKNKKINEEKQERAIECINHMLTEERQVTVSMLVKKTGLSRAYFYNNKKVNDALKKAQSSQKGINFVKRQSVMIDKALERECDILKKRLKQKEEEIDELKKENLKLKKMAKARTLELINKL